MKVKQSSVSLLLFLLALVASAIAAEPREMPVPLRTVAPAYPADLRAQKISGLVMVKATVDNQGVVVEAVAVNSSNPRFESAAIEAVKKWKFKPASENGQPVQLAVTIPMKFTADDAS